MAEIRHVEVEDDQNESLFGLHATQPTGTISSSVVNIANTMMGAGMLALPSAIASVGLGLGCILVTVAAFAGGFGMFLLVEAASRVGRSSSFFAVSKITYPGAAVIFDTAIAIKCFGVSVSYLVIWGDLLPKVVYSLFPSIPETSFLLMKSFWITLGVIGISPFVFLRRLDSLKYISGLALSSVVYLVLVVVYYFIFPLPQMPPKLTWDQIEWVKFDWVSFLTALPIFVFAYTCHQNVFSVYNELINNNEERIFSVISYAGNSAHWTYQLIGVLGYLTFGNAVSSNIIANYPTTPLISFGQLAIAFLVLFSYPLQAHPARASLDKVITSGIPVSPMPPIKFIFLSLILLVFSYIIAIKVNNLSTVLSVVGATGSTTIGYILPGIFYWRIREDEDILAEDLLESDHIRNASANNDSVEVRLDPEGLDPRDDAVLFPQETSALLADNTNENGHVALESAPLVRKRTRARNPKWDAKKIAAVVLANFGIVLMISSVSMQIWGAGRLFLFSFGDP